MKKNTNQINIIIHRGDHQKKWGFPNRAKARTAFCTFWFFATTPDRAVVIRDHDGLVILDTADGDISKPWPPDLFNWAGFPVRN